MADLKVASAALSAVRASDAPTPVGALFVALQNVNRLDRNFLASVAAMPEIATGLKVPFEPKKILIGKELNKPLFGTPEAFVRTLELYRNDDRQYALKAYWSYFEERGGNQAPIVISSEAQLQKLLLNSSKTVDELLAPLVNELTQRLENAEKAKTEGKLSKASAALDAFVERSTARK